MISASLVANGAKVYIVGPEQEKLDKLSVALLSFVLA